MRAALATRDQSMVSVKGDETTLLSGSSATTSSAEKPAASRAAKICRAIRAFVLVVGPRAPNAHPLWNALWSIARASAAGPHLCPACTGGETATQPFWVQET